MFAIGGLGYWAFQAAGFEGFSAGIAAQALLVAIVLVWTGSYLFRVVSGNMTYMEQRRRYRSTYDAATDDELQKRFDAAYWERFGVELPEIRAVLVNLHTAVIGLRKRFDLAVLGRSDRAGVLDGAKNGERQVWLDGGFRATPVYQREKLPADARFDGPAIIEQLDCTTVIEPGNKVRVDALGNLLVEIA